MNLTKKGCCYQVKYGIDHLLTIPDNPGAPGVPQIRGMGYNVSMRNYEVKYDKHCFIIPDKPGAPGVPQISNVKGSSMTIDWTPPANNGGSEITGYVLEYKMEGAFKYQKASKVGQIQTAQMVCYKTSTQSSKVCPI